MKTARYDGKVCRTPLLLRVNLLVLITLTCFLGSTRSPWTILPQAQAALELSWFKFQPAPAAPAGKDFDLDEDHGTLSICPSPDVPRASTRVDRIHMGHTLEMFINKDTSFILQLLDEMDAHKLFRIPLKDIDQHLPKEKSLELNPDMKFKNKALERNSLPNLMFRLLRKMVVPQYENKKGLTRAQLLEAIEKDVTYNFIVNDKELVFMKAGSNGTIRGTISKHFLLAKFKKHVRYAGEFTLTSAGKFIIRNASGTYRPSKEGLPSMRQLLKENWGEDLDVETVEFVKPAETKKDQDPHRGLGK